MKIATLVGKDVKMIGQYGVVNCDNCGKLNGNWFTADYSFIDCACTLFKTGSKYRTIMKKPNHSTGE